MYGAQHLALASLAATFAAAQYSAESSPVPILSNTATATYSPAYTVTNEYDRTITSACPTSSAMKYTLSGVIFSSSNIRTLDDGENCVYEGTQTNSVIFQSTPGPDATTRFGPNPGPEPTTTITPLAIPTSLPPAYGDIPPASARITTVTPPFGGGPPNTYTLVDCQALSAAPGRNVSAYRYTAPGGQVAYAPQIFNNGVGSCAIVPTPTYSYTGTGPVQSRVTAILTTGANSTVAGSPTSTPEPYAGGAPSSQMMTGGMLGVGGAVVLAVAVML
ncbi:hypothetical protein KC361_g2372 [Hortaea werneckii]|nr:hypothetical protein KC361_g2372 [Hortaea werneckii]KAI7509088.1 hypothetical protein KC347_g5552 [Hortaea werneckii]